MYFVLLLLFTTAGWSQEFSFDGMVDSYYAFDSNHPKNQKRSFTTQPSRHNRPSLNLAYLGLGYKSPQTRARLALQTGDSVTRNTEMEPALGQSRGELTAKIIQEAFVGKKLGNDTWLDAGIYLGHIGAESWISKDNWTYSRALNLDYVPYYSAGLRLSHQLNQKESIQFHVMNGWQIMSENNQAKSIGLQYQNLLTNELTFTYNNYFGDEKVVPNKQQQFHSRFRGYHNFILRWLANKNWQYLGALDFGHQAQQDNHGVDGFWAATLTIRRILNSTQSLALRLETYQDRHEANVSTESRKGFEVSGASFNFDQKISTNALWRTEIRNFQSQQQIYPSRTRLQKSDSFIVTSLAIWF